MASVHIIGGGISGLAAATALAEQRIPVKLYEATAHAGGRCRSSRDRALGTIDHGLHVTSTGDAEFARYVTRIGTQAQRRDVPGLRWPAAPLADYLPLLAAWLRPRGRAVDAIVPSSRVHDAWLKPFARVLEGTAPNALPARALRHAWRWRQLQAPTDSLQATYVQPALDFLDRFGGSVYFSHPLSRIERSGDTVTLVFPRKKVPLAPGDVLILATPSYVTQAWLPELPLAAPMYPAITLHFACAHRETVGSIAWPEDAPMDLLRFDDGRIGAMLRLAEHAWQGDADLFAQRCWKFLQTRYAYLRDEAMPEYALWREKRAGHAVTDAPPVPHDHGRMLLAGDWLDPTRPATLEAAALHGHRAALLAAERLRGAPEQNHRQFYLN